MRQRKQPGTGFMCRLVFCPETEEAGYEDAEGVSVRKACDHADDRLLPLANLALNNSKRSSDLILAHGRGRNVNGLRGICQPNGQTEGKSLFRFTLRQPLLTPPLRFALLGFFSDTRLLVKPSALQFAEEPFPREFLFGDLEGFFDVIIEDFDFHSSRLSTFPGDACAGFFLEPAWSRPGGAV